MNSPANRRLTDTQLKLLNQVAEAGGTLVLLNVSVRKHEALTRLRKLGLFERVNEELADACELTTAGWTNLGLKPPTDISTDREATSSSEISPPTIFNGLQQVASQPRSGTKLSLVVELLARSEGGSVGQICEKTGWLPHTSRATLTGLKKRGYQILRVDGVRPALYRIVSNTPIGQ